MLMSSKRLRHRRRNHRTKAKQALLVLNDEADALEDLR
jgi:hypothetical protein